MAGTFLGETNFFSGSTGHNRMIVNLRGVYNGTSNFGKSDPSKVAPAKNFNTYSKWQIN